MRSTRRKCGGDSFREFGSGRRLSYSPTHPLPAFHCFVKHLLKRCAARSEWLRSHASTEVTMYFISFRLIRLPAGTAL